MKITVNQINQLINLFEIEEAYEGEGNAGASFEEIEIKKDYILLKIKVGGYSTVEHEGDIRSIEDNVYELKADKKEHNISIDEKTYTVLIVDSNVTITGEPHGDCDYSVKVSGYTTLKILTK